MAGLHLLNEISWFKPNGSPCLGCRCFTASHESLLWAKKSPKAKHCFNYDEAVNGDWSKDFLKSPGKQMRSVWSIPTPGPKEKVSGRHPTQKPIALLNRIISTTTRPGETILDPFSGSSTTGIVAQRLGRKFTGIETSKRYLSLSVRRFSAGMARNFSYASESGVL